MCGIYLHKVFSVFLFLCLFFWIFFFFPPLLEDALVCCWLLLSRPVPISEPELQWEVSLLLPVWKEMQALCCPEWFLLLLLFHCHPRSLLVTCVGLCTIQHLVWLVCDTVCDVGLFVELYPYSWKDNHGSNPDPPTLSARSKNNSSFTISAWSLPVSVNITVVCE